MAVNLWNLLGPVLLICTFYALLGLVVWSLLRPPREPGARHTPFKWPGRRLPSVPVDRVVAGQVGGLAAAGIAGIIVPAPAWVHWLGMQALAAAVLIALLEFNQRRRESQRYERQLLAALRHPVATVALESLRQAEAAGRLTDGSMAGQDWRRVQWAGAHLAGADLRNSDLSEADLQRADLRAAVLDGCALNGANLTKADLTGATMVGANLNSVRASTALCAHADLSHATLRLAKLSGADMTAAILDDADMGGANLKGARLDYARLTATRYDGKTRWPKRFDPLLAGALPHTFVDTSAGNDR